MSAPEVAPNSNGVGATAAPDAAGPAPAPERLITGQRTGVKTSASGGGIGTDAASADAGGGFCLAANAAKISKAPDAGALQALADMHEGLIKMDWPKDKRSVEKMPAQAWSIAMNKKNKYQYLCACSPAVQDENGNFPPDPAGMPLYECVYDFKSKRLRLDDRQMCAVL